VIVEADAAAALAALAELVPESRGLEALAGRLASIGEATAAGLRDSDPEAAEFLSIVSAALPDEAILVCDMCIPGYWLGGFHNPAAPRKLSYPLGWGTLGCAFPQGLGAALAERGPAVSVSGDGGFLFACGELATAAQERIPLTAVVVDDGGYGMLRFDQDRRGDPREGVDLVTPDFTSLAGSFGVRAEAVAGLGAAFGEALERHLALDEPSLLVAAAALGPPPNTSPRWYRAAAGSR
jgi:acetolactate synthase-1/2/3 large subunit